jgi:DNA-binding XRE family transcriptional regulator
LDKTEFSIIRKHLGKTQRQISDLLGVSLKAVQSFEQGWRAVPVHVERQLFFLAAKALHQKIKPARCWTATRCQKATRKLCPAWEFRCGDLCWFINGTICHGQIHHNWETKMRSCRQCKVFQSQFSFLLKT